MKTVYFVRHGQSEANKNRITAGSGLDIDLTQAGTHQALQAGNFLKDKNIQLIVSSPMKRAYHTASIIAQQVGYDPSQIVTNDKFTERYLGDMTGKPHDEVQTWFSMGITPPGGESTEQMHDRIVTGLDWLKSLEADNIVLVSHGGPGRMIRSILQDESHASIDSLTTIGNAQIQEFTL